MSIKNKFGLFINIFLSTILIIFISSSFTSNESESTKLPQKILAVDISGEYDLAGEKVPIELPDIYERLDRELIINSYRHSSTLVHLKRSAKYFPAISIILQQYQIPDDFKYLAVAESALSNAISPSGAKGFWQFMKLASKEMELEVNSYVDERYHLEKATHAACQYILKLKERFGTWTNAAAAYNMGPTAFEREQNAQRETDYYRMNLSEETNRYVFRIVAIKEIMKNPDKYGFQLNEGDLYRPEEMRRILMTEPIENLGDWAHAMGISYRQLKYYNPWLINSKLPNSSNKEYIILVPAPN